LPKQGDDFTFTFDAPGTFAYYCDVHAGMTGEITVD
jgi:plastocyanin